MPRSIAAQSTVSEQLPLQLSDLLHELKVARLATVIQAQRTVTTLDNYLHAIGNRVVDTCSAELESVSRRSGEFEANPSRVTNALYWLPTGVYDILRKAIGSTDEE